MQPPKLYYRITLQEKEFKKLYASINLQTKSIIFVLEELDQYDLTFDDINTAIKAFDI